MPASGTPARPQAPGTPRVVILGGGFAGLYAAMRLRRAPVHITLLDRSNHHVFQPLLYQVATASLTPADIAQPIRWVLRRQRNAEVLLAEAAAVDPSGRTVRCTDGSEVQYDWLIVATGSTHSYFGHDDWAAHAPGLKSIADAIEMRERFLVAFEAAEREPDPRVRRAILTFVVVGGGPTGVELAGAMAEVARRALPHEFRHIDPSTARIFLIEAGPRLLAAFPEELGRRARADLEAMGVDVWPDSRVTAVDALGVTIGDERIATRNVYWAAGVRASPLGASLGAPRDRAGRVEVGPDLTIPGHPEIFVTGDLARVMEAGTNAEVPGVAPAAMQMGRYAAGVIAREVTPPAPGAAPARRPFRYRDKGNLATIGRARAVGMIGRWRLTGLLAWILWLGVHISYLIGFRNRIGVLVQWAWAYVRWIRRARLITRNAVEELERIRRPVREAPAPKPEPRAEPVAH